MLPIPFKVVERTVRRDCYIFIHIHCLEIWRVCLPSINPMKGVHLVDKFIQERILNKS